MIARIVYSEINMTHRWRCAVGVGELGAMIMHLVGTGWGMTKPEALANAIQYAEDALATVQYKIVGKLRPYFLYKLTEDNQWQCYVNVAHHGEGAALEVGRGIGSTKELALTAAIKFAEDALELVKRKVI